MKKTKLLMPILGVGAVAATVAPMVAMTSCNKDEEEVGEFRIQNKNITTDAQDTAYFTFVWTRWDDDHYLQLELAEEAIFSKKSNPSEQFEIVWSPQKINTPMLSLAVHFQPKTNYGDFDLGDTIIGNMTFRCSVFATHETGEPERQWDQTFKDISITRANE